MREDLLLYYPLNLPRPNRAARWRQTAGYCDFAASGGPMIRRVTLRETLPRLAPPRKIVFAADLHYGGRPSELRLADELARALEELAPDILLLGGDTVADACELDSIPGMLRKIGGTIPVKLAIPGNWERGKRWLGQDFYRELFAAGGFRYLCNELWSDPFFSIYGSDDIGFGEPRLPETLAPESFRILLAHRPDTVIALDDPGALDRFDLILCGHTHGGQLRLPGIGPLLPQGHYGTSFAYGLFEHGRYRMFVTSGLNHRSFPFRFRCRREILLLNFQPLR